jgi:ectoine hydroxylase-related dioxygenase (phytanoyl-CoA dioxygenase family)
MKTSQERIREAYDQYREEGYTTVENAVDDTLVGDARSHIDWLLEENPDLRPEELGHELVADDPFWVRLVSDERLLDVVEEFIGPDIALFASHYIAKPPGEGQPVLWHQDGVYWPLAPKEDVVTIWLALDQTRPSNGCMQVVPGSQTLELQEITENTEVDNVLSSEIDMDVDTSDARPIELEPGDVSLHHPNVLHGSDPNRSYTWRRGLTIRYIPATTSIEDGPWESAFVLRGDPEPGVNDYQPWPLASEADHIEFAGADAYDDRAREMNERVAEAGHLVD